MVNQVFKDPYLFDFLGTDMPRRKFARNTVDSLTYIRKLKERNISVFFEKENIDTLGSGGEMLITILSSQVQEESRNLSENVHWGYVRKFENGVVYVNCKKFLGYTKDADGNLVIVPEEAELVRRIFRMFLEGKQQYKNSQNLDGRGSQDRDREEPMACNRH